MKCWIKSQCLPVSHRERCIAVMQEITGDSVGMNDQPMAIDNPISQSEANHIAQARNALHLLDTAQTPLSELMNEIETMTDAAELCQMLNSPAPYDNEPTRSEISESMLHDLFDSHVRDEYEPTNSEEGDVLQSHSSNQALLMEMVQCMSKISDMYDDTKLQETMEAFVSRADELGQN